MSGKSCCVTKCSNTNIVARKILTTVPLFENNNGSDQPPNEEPITIYRYFCKDHIEVDEKELKLGAGRKISKLHTEDLPVHLRGKQLKLVSTSPNVFADVISARTVYSNRKRKHISDSQPQCSKFNYEGPSYTLNEQNNKDNTYAVNLSFEKFQKYDSEELEDGEPTFTIPENSDTQSIEDNDCFITNESSTTIIDLVDDEKEGCEEDNMIEVILCNDTEPDSSEATLEHEIDVVTNEESNGLEDQHFQHPTQVNSTVSDDRDTAIHSIDLTQEENMTGLLTIDLTDELISDETTTSVDADSESDAIIEKIKRDLCRKYPGTVESISRNKENNELEIDICKNDSFKSDDEFNEYLLEVARMIKDSPFVFDKPLQLTKTTQEKSIEKPASHPTNQKKVVNETEHTRSLPVVLNKNYYQTQRDVFKEAEAEIAKEDHAKSLNDNSTSNNLQVPNKTPSNNLQVPNKTPSNNSQVPNKTQSNNSRVPNKIQVDSNYNARQILKKCKSYLGVTTETFHTIEDLLKDRFKNKSLLILLLRKIKLNEPFAILSDVLCLNKEDCINIYEEFLPVLSRTLKGFLQWPTCCRESVAIVEIFEIEIEKPTSFIEQTISFCNQRQRYLVKFLICCTPTGYIAHVSVPFFTIHANIFKTCLDSIPKTCSTVVVNPSLSNFGNKFTRNSTRIVTFDCSHRANKNCVKLAFDRMRCFNLMKEILDRKNLKLLQHTVSVVACLCNLEAENK